MVPHVQRLVGVLDLFGVSERDLLVSSVYLFFWWPASSIVTAFVSGRLLHGTQDPGFECAGQSRDVGQDRACEVTVEFRRFVSMVSLG